MFQNKLKDRIWVLEREIELFSRLLVLKDAEIRLLQAKNEAQRFDITRLLDNVKELQSRPVPERSKVPLYESEDEEDIRYLRENSLISIAEAEDMLRQLEFDNQTILVE